MSNKSTSVRELAEDHGDASKLTAAAGALSKADLISLGRGDTSGHGALGVADLNSIKDAFAGHDPMSTDAVGGSCCCSIMCCCTASAVVEPVRRA